MQYDFREILRIYERDFQENSDNYYRKLFKVKFKEKNKEYVGNK